MLHLHILICPILIWPAEKARIFPDNMLSTHMPQNRVSLSKVATCCALLQLLYLLTKSCLSTVPYKWISSSTGNIFYPHNIRHFNTLLMVSASLLCGNNQSMIILPYSDIITLFCNLNITWADSTCKLSMTACSWCFLNKSKII